MTQRKIKSVHINSRDRLSPENNHSPTRGTLFTPAI